MKRKSLLNRSGVDWGDHTGRYPLLYNCNIYYGCQHDCTYCYSQRIYRWKVPWRDVEPVENAVVLSRNEVQQKDPGRIMVCSMTDPYQPV
jgi:DNA repair photolyase